MSQEMSQHHIKPQSTTNSRVALIILVTVVALIAGFLGGILSSRFRSLQMTQSTTQPALKDMKEITVSKDGLLFKMEDGTPIVRLGVDTYGAYMKLLNTENRPVVQLSESSGEGVLTVGTSVGTSVYIIAHNDGGTITMPGKYGKQVVRLSSFTESGAGSLVLGEGAQGYDAVVIGTERNKKDFTGTITIFNENGTEWRAP